jgi:hypothetical protein
MEDTRHLHITFFVEAVQDKAASLKEGRPIFKDQEFVRIKFVADKNRELVAPAHDKYKFMRDPITGDGQYITYAMDFPRHYQAFKDGLAVAGEGTPIEELPFITAAKRAELKALHIHTAEALAQLDGTPLQRLGIGGRELKNQAEAFLAKAKDSALETRLAAQNASLTEELEKMKAQMADLMRMQGQPVAPDGLPDTPGVPTGASQFEDWEDADLKNFVKERTGTAPRGNPKHETLVSMAEDVAAKESQAA